MFSLGNKILSHRLVHFVNDLIPTDLFPYLSCLSQEDKEKVLCVETNDGPSRATYTLVDRLQKKSNNCDKAFREFVRALRKTGSDHVAILLDPQYAGKLKTKYSSFLKALWKLWYCPLCCRTHAVP